MSSLQYERIAQETCYAFRDCSVPPVFIHSALSVSASRGSKYLLAHNVPIIIDGNVLKRFPASRRHCSLNSQIESLLCKRIKPKNLCHNRRHSTASTERSAFMQNRYNKNNTQVGYNLQNNDIFRDKETVCKG